MAASTPGVELLLGQTDRQVPTGILLVLKTGIPWEDLRRRWAAIQGLPAGVGWPNGKGVWGKLHEVSLAKLHAADRID